MTDTMTNGKDWAEEEALRTMEAIASDAPPNRWPSTHIGNNSLCWAMVARCSRL